MQKKTMRFDANDETIVLCPNPCLYASNNKLPLMTIKAQAPNTLLVFLFAPLVTAALMVGVAEAEPM